MDIDIDIDIDVDVEVDVDIDRCAGHLGALLTGSRSP